MKHLGILATTPEGAALCFRAFCQEGFSEIGPHDHPDVTLDLALPGLHMAEVVADLAVRDGGTRVGVLGTKHTMDGPVYPRALAARGIAADLPVEDDRTTVNEIIFDELVRGVFTESSRKEYVRIIERLTWRGGPVGA